MKSSTKNIAIHQFTPNVVLGDGVSGSVLYIQKLLQELGFVSKIYVAARFLDLNLKQDISHIEQYEEDAHNVLVYHHSIGHSKHQEIMEFADKKILLYHNITPPYFFKNYPRLQSLCIQGREQLAASSAYFIGSIGDSEYNTNELRHYNYKNPTTLVLLLDLEKEKKQFLNDSLIQKYHAVYNIIFVGRIVSNKAQHQLLDLAFALKNKGVTNFKIHIIGGASDPHYYEYLQNYRKELDLEAEVHITGKVSDAVLAAYYTLADLYLSLSNHEGFGIPLVEAMRYDVPVLSYEVGGIGTALPAICLLQRKAPSYLVQRILELQNDPFLRYKMVKAQQQKLATFSHEKVRQAFFEYLCTTLDLQTQPHAYSIEKKIEREILHAKPLGIEIEGPFDSSYSLALVNKDIAHSLAQNPHHRVSLYSTEGGGDFVANLENLDLQTIQLANNKLEQIDITIRNLYPPRTNAMKGYHKIIGPYGWEESAFPKQYVDWFNTKLTMVFAMSQYVKDVLKNNGVDIPIYTTGIVVEDILNTSSTALNYPLPQGFRLLHISSCFPRKGVNVLLEAFEHLEEDISLTIKTFPNPHNTIKEQIENLGYKLLICYEKECILYAKNKKQILVINKDISQAQIKYLYENTDALVAPSFGEGFGLPMAEAMLFELPVITTNHSGQCDFCTEKTAWMLTCTLEPAKTHINLSNSLWAVPKAKALQDAILTVYHANATTIQHKTDLAKAFILKNYSSVAVAAKITDAFADFEKTAALTKQKIAWVSSSNTKCGIATYSDFILEYLKKEPTLQIKIFASHTQTPLIANKEKQLIRCWNDRFDLSNTALIDQIVQENCTKVVINFNFAFFSMKNLAQIIEKLTQKNIGISIIFHSVADVTIKGLESSLSWIKESLDKVDALLVHTQEDIKFFQALGLENAYYLPHGVTNRIDTMPAPKEDIKRIASYGFLLPHKGILDLINAFAILVKEFAYLELLLVNAVYPVKLSQEYLVVCQKRVQELGLGKKVIFHSDFLSDEASYALLDTSDLLVMPYHHTNESSSGAIRYAISTLQPVVCTQEKIFDNVKDIVHFIEGKEIEDMAASIKKLITNKNLRISKTEQQKAWVQRHDWKNIANRVADFLK